MDTAVRAVAAHVANAVLTGEIVFGENVFTLPNTVVIENDERQETICVHFPEGKPKWNGTAVPVSRLTLTADDESLTIKPDVPFLPGLLEPSIRIPL